jgi:hypothetical protein
MNYVLPLLLAGVLAGGAGYASIEFEDAPLKAGLQAPAVDPMQRTRRALTRFV